MRSFNLTNPLGNIYTEAKLPAYKRKGLNWIMCGNLCGNLWGIICGSGTAAMVGLAIYSVRETLNSVFLWQSRRSPP